MAAKEEVEDQCEGIENGTGSERDLLATEASHVKKSVSVLGAAVHDSLTLHGAVTTESTHLLKYCTFLQHR